MSSNSPSATAPCPVAPAHRTRPDTGAPPAPPTERRALIPVISDRHAPHQQPYGTAYEQLLEKVRYQGAYPTRERADDGPDAAHAQGPAHAGGADVRGVDGSSQRVAADLRTHHAEAREGSAR